MTDINETPDLEPDPNPVQVKKPPKRKPPRQKSGEQASNGVGLPIVLVCSAIATVLGVTGGAWLGSTLTEPQAATQTEVSKAELETVRSAVETLKIRTAKIEKQQSEIMQGKAVVSGAGLGADLGTDLGADMGDGEDVRSLFTAIEARLKTLEAKAQNSAMTAETRPEEQITEESETASKVDKPPVDQSDEIDENEENPNTDTAVNSDQEDRVAPESSDTKLRDELNTLADNLSALEKQLESQSETYVSLSDLNGLKRRVKTLETEFEKPPVLIPPFPRDSVMDALTGKAEKSGSWMSGLLGDEVRVVDAEIVSRLDRIEKFVEAGDITAIDKELTYLPAEAQPVIDSWLAQFKQSK